MRRGAVVAFGVFDEQAGTDRVVVVAETKETDETERQRIAKLVAEAVVEGTGLPVDEVLVVDPSTIPKTSSGKGCFVVTTPPPRPRAARARKRSRRTASRVRRARR